MQQNRENNLGKKEKMMILHNYHLKSLPAKKFI